MPFRELPSLKLEGYGSPMTDSPYIPIWVSFPNLHPHLFSPRILHGLASLFGRPLRTDNATSTGSRPSVSRILVELDVTKHYPDQVWLGSETLGYFQFVEMEEFPSYCAHYKILGHLKAECHILHPHVNVNADVNVDPLRHNDYITLTVAHIVEVVSALEVKDCEQENVYVDGSLQENIVLWFGGQTVEPQVEDVSNPLLTDLVVNNNGCNVFSAYMDLVCNGGEGIELIPSPTDLEKGPNLELCQANMEVVNDFSSDLETLVGPKGCEPVSELVPVDNDEIGNALDTPTRLSVSYYDDFDLVDNNVVTPLIEVPISIISSDALFGHLISKSRDYEMMHGDWLNIGISSDCGEEIFEKDLDSQENFDLSIIQFAEDIGSKKSVKRGWRKSKKKKDFLFEFFLFGLGRLSSVGICLIGVGLSLWESVVSRDSAIQSYVSELHIPLISHSSVDGAKVSRVEYGCSLLPTSSLPSTEDPHLEYEISELKEAM
ncbi:hypothetical protein M5K25_006268 [Dendrobium thyrsiflorum]|uniref:DUF4283 domain-containing protein n=1 Tax=Dendrobium thyrsiflorum TaxID=117978 RepID=A0ABD0VC50_DENTH